MSSNAPGSSANSSTGNDGRAIYILILSVAGLIVWLEVTSLQIMSSENTINHIYNGFVPSFRILQQWPAVVNGRVSPIEVAAFVYGWGIEILVLFFASAYEFVKHATKGAHPVLARVFFFCLILAFILDAASDYNYLPDSVGIWWRLGYAVVSATIVAFLGLMCMNGLIFAFKNWH